MQKASFYWDIEEGGTLIMLAVFGFVPKVHNVTRNRFSMVAFLGFIKRSARQIDKLRSANFSGYPLTKNNSISPSCASVIDKKHLVKGLFHSLLKQTPTSGQ